MLTPPDGLPEDTLVAVLAREWGVDVRSMAYRPVAPSPPRRRAPR
ncbi:hypothetical protein ACFFWE_09205 [Sphaerisporangium melleum]|nr:hypothetical protein [Sphaerisporangium melleum]